MSVISELGKDVEADVKKAKENGCVVEYQLLDDNPFVYRSLNRFEWKVLQTKSIEKTKSAEGTQIDPLKLIEHKEESEDAVVLKGLIYPNHNTSADLSSYPAGYIAHLADLITALSGFGEPTVEPVRL